MEEDRSAAMLAVRSIWLRRPPPLGTGAAAVEEPLPDILARDRLVAADWGAFASVAASRFIEDHAVVNREWRWHSGSLSCADDAPAH